METFSAIGRGYRGQNRATFLSLLRLDSLQLLVHAVEVKAHGDAKLPADRTDFGNDLIIRKRIIL
jgi:hypothetical protein